MWECECWGQVDINPSRAASHLTAVAPGQSQRDTLSALDHCRKCFYFFGGYFSGIFLHLGSVEFFAKIVLETGLSMKLCHWRLLASWQWSCTKAKYPSEWEEPSPTNWTFSGEKEHCWELEIGFFLLAIWGLEESPRRHFSIRKCSCRCGMSHGMLGPII